MPKKEEKVWRAGGPSPIHASRLQTQGLGDYTDIGEDAKIFYFLALNDATNVMSRMTWMIIWILGGVDEYKGGNQRDESSDHKRGGPTRAKFQAAPKTQAAPPLCNLPTHTNETSTFHSIPFLSHPLTPRSPRGRSASESFPAPPPGASPRRPRTGPL